MRLPSDLPRLVPIQLIASPAPGTPLLPALRPEVPDALRLPTLGTHGAATLLCVPT